MSAQTPEIAAATLEHSERIRLLTGRVDKQRRSIVKLSYIVAVLLCIQVAGLLSIPVSPAMSTYLVIVLVSAGLAGLVNWRRNHAV